MGKEQRPAHVLFPSTERRGALDAAAREAPEGVTTREAAGAAYSGSVSPLYQEVTEERKRWPWPASCAPCCGFRWGCHGDGAASPEDEEEQARRHLRSSLMPLRRRTWRHLRSPRSPRRGGPQPRRRRPWQLGRTANWRRGGALDPGRPEKTETSIGHSASPVASIISMRVSVYLCSYCPWLG